MSRKIALEENLSSFAPYLKTKGFEIELLHSTASSPLDNYAAVVVSGQTNNFLNYQNISTSAPVIDASGLTSEQVYQHIQRVIERQ